MRHWTLYDSLYHSRYVAAKLRIWELLGQKALRSLLVNWGVKLEEAKQPFQHLPLGAETKLLAKLEAPGERLQRLLGSDVVYESFTRIQRDKSETCAADVVRAVDGLLEDCAFLDLPERQNPLESKHFDDMPVTAAMSAVDPLDYERSLVKRWNQNVTDAMKLLSGSDSSYFQRGLKLAIEAQKEVVKMGTRLIEKRHLHNVGTFRYAEIHQKNNFTNPVALSRLASFTLDAYRERNPKKLVLPLVICSLCDVRNCFVVVGVPPNKQMGDHKENAFGAAFRLAREKVNAHAKHMGFETAVIEVNKDDLKRFLSAVHMQLIDD